MDGQCSLALACCAISGIDDYDGSGVVAESEAV
jgi:hypothetical protein